MSLVLKSVLATLFLGATITGCMAVPPLSYGTHQSFVTGVQVSQGVVIDAELEEFKDSYISSLEIAESTDYRLEADMKMGLNQVTLLPGYYTKVEYNGGIDSGSGIVAIEKIRLGEDRGLSYDLTIYRKGGKSYRWNASGTWSTAGEVLMIKNIRGDSRLLPFDVVVKNRSEPIKSDNPNASPVKNHHPIKILCDRELIARVRSLHAIHDQSTDLYQTNMLAQVLGDDRWHWITDAYEDSATIKKLFEKALELNWHAHPEDRIMLDDWSSKVALWYKSTKSKNLTLYNAGD